MPAGMNDEQIERMSKTVFRYCLSRTDSYHDAEDMAQEILLVACKTMNRFENEKAFYAFVWKTAVNKLLEYDLLKKKGMSYQSNIVILTRKELEEIRRYSAAGLQASADAVREFADSSMDGLRELGFYGSGMPANSLRWMLVSLILRRAYVEMLQSGAALEYPTDCFGSRCFRFLMEQDMNDPYFMGVSAQTAKDGTIFFWDVPVNGEMVHPIVSPVRAGMLVSLMDSQPATDSEKLVCSELLELCLARKEGAGFVPNFPCLNAGQSAALSARIMPVAESICGRAKRRAEGLVGIMAEHAPEHLADYAKRLPALIQLREAGTVMQRLCESGWLLPFRAMTST